MVSVVFVRDSAGIHGGVFARAEIAAEYRKLKMYYFDALHNGHTVGAKYHCVRGRC